ncbi:NUDIX hydrolase [Fodinibius sp. Rm-B-1B1-1]|uniref:NUDIX hydrolase n=1 Tax=Fodinibius alkaliphilus TaxID=3140241 RepID=UPI00315B3CCB
MEVESIKAAGGVVVKESNSSDPFVLLIYRRGVWDMPKGKLDEGETIKECSVREVSEEVGTPVSPNIIFDLQETYHEYERHGIHYGKTTYWFAMKFPDDAEISFRPETEEGIQEVSWERLSDAKTLVGYENLIEVLNTFELKYREFREDKGNSDS